MGSYSEEELRIRFIGPLLNKVDYRFKNTRDWYQRPLKAKINKVTIGGYVDFMVAKGFKEPEIPYFFIQEFKRTKFETDPEDQLLAEMLVAMTITANDGWHIFYYRSKRTLFQNTLCALQLFRAYLGHVPFKLHNICFGLFYNIYCAI